MSLLGIYFSLVIRMEEDDNRILLDTVDPDLNHYVDNIVDFNSYSQDAICDILDSNGAFNVLHHNVRSILSEGKKDEIDVMLNKINNPFHVLAFTETWLNGDNHNMIEFSGFDHISNVRANNQTGGGLSIFIRNNIDFKIRDDLNVMLPHIETLFIEVPHNNIKYLVGVVYRIPNTNIELFTNTLNSLIEPIKNNFEIILAGDYNICLQQDNNYTREFRNCLQSNSLFPTILEATRVATVVRNGVPHMTHSLIDNIFINDKVDYKSGIIYSSISDHYPIFISIKNKNFDSNRNLKLIKYRLIDDFRVRKFNSAIKVSFNNILLETDDAPVAFTNFLNKFYDLYNKHFPIVTKLIPIKSLLNPWVTTRLADRLKIKDNLNKLSNLGRIDRVVYTRFRNKITAQIRQAKAKFYDQEFVKCQSNIRKTWKIINNTIRRKIKETRVSLSENNDIIESSQVPDKFIDYFSNIAKDLVSKNNHSSTKIETYLKNRISNSFHMSEIFEKDISDAIANLKCNGQGINKISANILKQVKGNLTRPLCSVFNKCINQGVFPSELKIGCITPIYKKGDRMDVSNYRPVCSLSTFSKIFERIVYNKMIEFINKFNIFSNSQYGFRQNKSTESALLDFKDYLQEGLKNKLSIGSVFMDLSKAFDVIDHSILKIKLEHYGFRGIFLTFLMNYIVDRKYFVNVNGINSKTRTVNIGVPQGSTLGPLLFLLYINDMKNCSEKLKFIQFADDTTLSFSHKCIMQLKNILIMETVKVINWLTANKLIVNLSKTHTMLFTKKHGNFSLQLNINNNVIEEKSETSFLGVIIDNKLTWKHHVTHTSAKISKSIALLRLVRYKFPKHILKLLYMSLIYSYLNYCNIVWGSAYQNTLEPLHKLQKKAIRIVNNSHYLDASAPIFKSLHLLNIYQVFKLNCLLFAYKCMKSNLYPNFKEKIIQVSSVHSYSTRQNDQLRPPFERLQSCQNSFLYQSVVLWNKLNDNMKNYNSISIYKKKVKCLLIDNMV